jgi:N-acetylglucosamine-6-phosphate deacetylase
MDLQINGYAGVDFQQDHLSAADLEQATRALRADGCQRWLLTLITDDWSRLMSRLQHLRQLRDQSDLLKQSILGWHIEGPFLSPEPGYAGAHSPDSMCDPRPDHIRQLRQITGQDPVLLTLAPERSGALDAIRLAVSLGIKVSLGHTNASADVLRLAVNAGATGFTHLGNGCPRDLDRHDNILWRVLDTPGLTISFIIDQIHIAPALLRLAHRILKPDQLFYTTDAMSAAGAPPGLYPLGSLQLQVGEDQIVRQPGSPLFAGSALRPIDGIRRMALTLQRSWQEIWPHFSITPGSFMGLEGDLVPGQPVSGYLLHLSAENQIQSLAPLSERVSP